MKASSEQVNLRFPTDLKAWLVAQAAESRRSLTSEVVVRLEESRKRDAKAQKVKPQ